MYRQKEGWWKEASQGKAETLFPPAAGTIEYSFQLAVVQLSGFGMGVGEEEERAPGEVRLG